MVERQQADRRDHRKPTRRSIYINSTVGVGGPNPTAELRPLLRRAQAQERARTRVAVVIARLRQKATADHRHGRRSSRSSRTSMSAAASRRANISTRCNRATPTSLYQLAPEMRDKIAKLPGLRDVTTDLYINNPQMTIEIDREKAGGLRHHHRSGPPGALQRLRHAPGRRRSTRRSTTTRSSWKRSRSSASIRRAWKIFVKTNARRRDRHDRGDGVTGNGIPSAVDPAVAVTKLVPSVGPLLVNHQGQQPAVTISFNLAPGFSLGDAVDAIHEHRARLQPAGHDRHRLPGHRAGVPGIR